MLESAICSGPRGKRNARSRNRLLDQRNARGGGSQDGAVSASENRLCRCWRKRSVRRAVASPVRTPRPSGPTRPRTTGNRMQCRTRRGAAAIERDLGQAEINKPRQPLRQLPWTKERWPPQGVGKLLHLRQARCVELLAVGPIPRRCLGMLPHGVQQIPPRERQQRKSFGFA